MDLFGKAFVFILIGLASSQRDPFADLNAQLDDSINELGRINGRVNLENGRLNLDHNPAMFNGQRVNFNGNPPFAAMQQTAQSPDSMLEDAFRKMQPSIDEVVEKCRKAQREDIANNFQSKARQTFDCVKRKIDVNQLMQDFETAVRTQTLDRLIRRLCNIWPDVHGCLNPIVTDARYCLDKDDEFQLNETMALLDNSTIFWCENNQKRSLDFFRDGGMQCIAEAGQRIGECTKPLKEKASDKKKDNLVYDAEDCSDMRTLRSCVVDAMQCQNSSPKTIVNDYLAIIQRVVCNSASTTWFSTFNILLVLCTFLYSKMF